MSACLSNVLIVIIKVMIIVEFTELVLWHWVQYCALSYLIITAEHSPASTADVIVISSLQMRKLRLRDTE